MWRHLVQMPEAWREILKRVAEERGESVTDVIRNAIYEYVSRRGYDIEPSAIKNGGYRIEVSVTDNGWINEYRLAKVHYGLDDEKIVRMDITNVDALDDYPLLQQAARHNSAEFNRQFPRDEDLTLSNFAYATYLDETGLATIRQLQKRIILYGGQL